MKKLLLFLLSASMAYGQGGRPPIDLYSQLRDVDVTGLQVNNIMVWNGTFWVPGASSSGGLPSISGQGGKFLTTDATTIFWGAVPFASLSSKPTTAAGYGITGGSNLDTWGTKTPYAGSLVIASGKTVSFPNTFSLTAIDGATLSIGSGGTLGTNAFSSAAFVLQTTTVNGHALSSNVTVTKTDLGLGYILSGAGSPEGAITAPVGSQYSRTDGGVSTSFYVKQTGTGNTGWTADALGVGSLPTGGTAGQSLVKNTSTDYDVAWATVTGTGGGGTVLDVGVTTANGVSATTANATDHPRMTFSLGGITPSSVASTGTVTGTNLSGTNTGDQTITLTGPVTGSGTGSFSTTITDSAVGLAKIASIPSNTILGNNTGGIASPIAMTTSQTKTLLSLNNVENTALSTWAGSTNITTVGNVTGSPPNSSIAYTLLPVGTTTATVAVGNDARFPASVTGIRKSSGAGSTDVAATPHVDFAIDAKQNGTNGNQVWTDGRTTFIEASPLTSDKTLTLPAAAAYVDGTVISLVDGQTASDGLSTHNFGRLITAGSGDTLTVGATVQSSAFVPFRGGGYGGNTHVAYFQKQGTNNWQVVGDIATLDYVQDPTTITKTFSFDASLQDAGNPPTTPPVPGVVTVAAGTSTTVKNLDATPGIFLTGLSTAGILSYAPIYQKDVLSNQDDIATVTGPPNTNTGNPHTVPNTGIIDNVRLSANLSASGAGPLTVVLPNTSNYRDGQAMFFYDASGSLSATNTVTLIPSSGDTVNHGASVVLNRDHDSRRILASSGDWSVESYGGSTGNGLSISPYVTLSDALAIDATCDQTLLEQNWSLTGTNGVGTTRTITIKNARQGEKFRFVYTHNVAGNDTIILQSAATPSNGLGLLNLSKAGGAVDIITGSVRNDGKLLVDNPSLNVTFAAAVAYSTPADSGPANTGSVNVNLGSATSGNTTYQGIQFQAGSSYTMGRVDLNLRAVGTPANLLGNVVVAIAADDIRSTDPTATVTSGSNIVTNAGTVQTTDLGQRVTSTTAGVIPNPSYIGSVDVVSVPHTFTIVTTKGGSTAQTISTSGTGISIWGKPNATPLVTSDPVVASSITATAYNGTVGVTTDYTHFTGFTTNITNGAIYWIVINPTNPLNNNTDYLQIRAASGNTGYLTRNGSSYPPVQAGNQATKGNFITYKP